MAPDTDLPAVARDHEPRHNRPGTGSVGRPDREAAPPTTAGQPEGLSCVAASVFVTEASWRIIR